MTVEHILDVLRVILRGIMVEFLLMRQLDWPGSVEELRGAIGTHVLKLESSIHVIASGSAAPTSLSDTRLLSTVRKDLAIEESEVVRACSRREALVWIGVRTELIYNILSVLRSGKELVSTVLIASSERLRTSQIVDELTAAARALIALLKLLLDDVLGL